MFNKNVMGTRKKKKPKLEREWGGGIKRRPDRREGEGRGEEKIKNFLFEIWQKDGVFYMGGKKSRITTKERRYVRKVEKKKWYLQIFNKEEG